MYIKYGRGFSITVASFLECVNHGKAAAAGWNHPFNQPAAQNTASWKTASTSYYLLFLRSSSCAVMLRSFHLVTSCLFTQSEKLNYSTNVKQRHRKTPETHLTPHRWTSRCSFPTLPWISRWCQRTAVCPRSAEPWRCTMCSWKEALMC